MRQPRIPIAWLEHTDELTAAVVAATRASNMAATIPTAVRSCDVDVETAAKGHGTDRDIIAVVRPSSVTEPAPAPSSTPTLLILPEGPRLLRTED